MPLVSVIIPTYNSAKFLSRTIESVLAQTYRNFELIIVDDVSTDDTVSIIRSFAEKDSRISCMVLDANSGGPARPTNKGLAVAKGDFIAFLDHDDEWLPEKLQEQVSFLQSASKDIGAVVCDVDLLTPDGTRRPMHTFPDYPTKESFLTAVLCANFFFMFSDLCMRREALQAVGLLDERYILGVDHDYYIRLAQTCLIGVVHKPLIRYAVHPQNLSRGSLSLTNAIADLGRVGETDAELFARHPRCYRRRMVQLGSALIAVGNMQQARSTLRTAFFLNPWAFDVPFYFLLSLLGKRIHRALKMIKNTVQNHA